MATIFKLQGTVMYLLAAMEEATEQKQAATGPLSSAR